MRTHGSTTTLLRLPERDAIRGEAAGLRTADPARRLTATGLGEPEALGGFASPQWDAPPEFPGQPFPSFPRRAEWRLLVAATARRPRAKRALHAYQRTSPRPAATTGRRLHHLIAANVGDADPDAERTWWDTATGLQRLVPVLQDFAAAGIPVALIKGLAAALLDYRDLGLRPMTDFDLLVRREDRPRAIARLEAMGFRPFFAGPERFAMRRHGDAYILPDQLNIDLHWHALWCNCWAGADGEFWRTAQPRELLGAPCFLPSAESRFLMACAHGLRLADTPAHHWIADAAMILTRHPTLNGAELAAEAHRRRLTCLLSATCDYLADAMGAPIPASVRAELKRAPAAWFERAAFESAQTPPARRGAVTGALFWWWNLYRQSAQGFRWREIAAFLDYVRELRGGHTLIGFLLLTFGRALSRLWRDLRALVFPSPPPP